MKIEIGDNLAFILFIALCAAVTIVAIVAK